MTQGYPPLPGSASGKATFGSLRERLGYDSVKPSGIDQNELYGTRQRPQTEVHKRVAENLRPKFIKGIKLNTR